MAWMKVLPQTQEKTEDEDKKKSKSATTTNKTSSTTNKTSSTTKSVNKSSTTSGKNETGIVGSLAKAAKTTNKSVTFSTLNTLKQNGTILSNIERKAQKDAAANKTTTGTTKSVTKSTTKNTTATSNTAAKTDSTIKPLDLNNTQNNVEVNSALGLNTTSKKTNVTVNNVRNNTQSKTKSQQQTQSAQKNESGLVGSLAATKRQSEKQQQDSALMQPLNLKNESANTAVNKVTGIGSTSQTSTQKNESGIVGSLAKQQREKQENNPLKVNTQGTASWYKQGQTEILEIGDEVAHMSNTTPETTTNSKGDTIVKDYTAGLTAKEKTEANMPLIEKSTYYRSGKAQLENKISGYDVQIASLDTQLLAQKDDQTGSKVDLQKQKNQLLMQRYYAQDRLDNLADETRVLLTNEGTISGSVAPEERVKYDVNQKGKSSGWFSAVETGLNMVGTTAYQLADSTPRDIATAFITAASVVTGADSAIDYLDKHQDQKAIFDRAYSPTQDLSDYSGTFGSDTLDSAQKLMQSATESLKTMAISFGLGAAGAGSAAGSATSMLTRLMQYVNSGIAAGAGAARDASNAGASATEAGQALLLTGIANAVLEQGGTDQILSTAANLGKGAAGSKLAARLASTKLGGKIIKKASSSVIAKGIKALKESTGTAGAIYRAGIDVLSSFISEGAEEVAEDVAGNAIAKAVYNTDMPWTGEGGVLDTEELTQDGLIGGGMGAAFTVIAGLMMPGKYRSNLQAQQIIENIEAGRSIDVDAINELTQTLNREIRTTEITAADADAHQQIWQANGTDAPESLTTWRSRAAASDQAQQTYTKARASVEQLIADIESGATDISTDEGMSLYNRTMDTYNYASATLTEAAQRNVDARTVYYADEDALTDQINGKDSQQNERMDEIKDAVGEVGDQLDARKMQSDENAERIRDLDAAIMNRDGIAGELAQAQEQENAATSPAEQLEAREEVLRLREEYQAADSEVETQKEELKANIQLDSDEVLAERMDEWRKIDTKHDSKYDNYTSEELTEERARLEKRAAALEEDAKKSKGARHKANKAAAQTWRNAIEAIDSELELRERVYGSQAAYDARLTGTNGADVVSEVENQNTVENADAQVETEAQTETQTETQEQTDADQQAESEELPRKKTIYRNGRPLMTYMTDSELDAEIARESQEIQQRAEQAKADRLKAAREAVEGMQTAAEIETDTQKQLKAMSNEQLQAEMDRLNDEADTIAERADNLYAETGTYDSGEYAALEQRWSEIRQKQSDLTEEMLRRGQTDSPDAYADYYSEKDTAQGILDGQAQGAQVDDVIIDESRLDEMNDEAARAAQEDYLEQLRAERDERSDPAKASEREVSAKLDEVDALIDDIESAADRDLYRNERWLKKRVAALENELRNTENEGRTDDTGAVMDELNRTQNLLTEIRNELHDRAGQRTEMAGELIDDMKRNGQKVTDQDYLDEKARIQANQKTAQQQLEKMKQERPLKRRWRTTDTITREEAARVFEGNEEIQDGMVSSIEEELKKNSYVLATWESKRDALNQSVQDMKYTIEQMERSLSIKESNGDLLSATEMRDALRTREQIAQMKTAMDKAKGLKHQINATIEYLKAHSGDTVIDAMQAGKLPQQMLERVMGFVDQITVPKTGSLGLNMNTANRVFDDLFGENAPVMRAIYIEPIAEHEASRQKFIGEAREKIEALKLNKFEREWVQRYGEGLTNIEDLYNAIDDKNAARGTKLKSGDGTWGNGDVNTDTDVQPSAEGWGNKADEVRRIKYAAQVFSGIYEDLYNQVNEAQVRNGYAPLGHLENYFPHFQDDAKGGLITKIAAKIGFGAQTYALPTAIDGLTEDFTPGKKYNKHAEHRTGSSTTYDAIAGFEDYVDAATQVAYLTDDIKRLRQLESAVRSGETTGTLNRRGLLDKANGDFGAFAKWLHEYANLVAGKKSGLDRGVEGTVGRKLYQVLDIIRSRRGAGAVAGNISSALTNITPVTQVISEHPAATMKAMTSMMMDLFNGNSSGVPESDFLTRRFASNRLDGSAWSKVESIASKPFEMVDTLASNIVVRANYYANLDAGMESEAAMHSADVQAARLMADRSLGQMPNMYKSRLFMATFGQFQLEVDNTLRHTFKDIPKSMSTGRATGTLMLLSVMSYLTNAAFKKLRGRSVMPDPIDTGMDTVESFQKTYEESGGDIWSSLWSAGSAAWEGIADALPYWNEGRIGQSLVGSISDTISDISDAAEAGDDAAKWNTALWSMMDYVTFGGQIKKTYQGIGALMEMGNYNKSGQLMYPVDASDTWTRIQAMVFGKSSTEYAVKYWDEGRSALTSGNTDKYLKLTAEGMTPSEAYEAVYDYQNMTKLKKKRDAATKSGDTALAEYYDEQYQALLENVDYDNMVVDESLQSEAGKTYYSMLETAYRESGNSEFVPEWYSGEFTKDGIKRKYTPESIEQLQSVYSARVDALMSQYEDTWDSMTESERKEAYVDAKSDARSYAKQYGFDNGLEYVDKSDYDSLGYTAPGNEGSEYEKPSGLTNPAFDTYYAAAGEAANIADAFGNAMTGNPHARTAGTTENTVESQSVGADQNASTVTDADLAAAADVSTAGTTKKSGSTSYSKSGSSRRRRSSSSRRSSGSSSGSSGGGVDLSAINVTPTTTVPLYRQKMQSSFGTNYNPYPLTNSFEWNGKQVTLNDTQMSTFSQMYDIYMDMAMQEQQTNWDAATNEQKQEMLAQMDANARAQAMEYMQMV